MARATARTSMFSAPGAIAGAGAVALLLGTSELTGKGSRAGRFSELAHPRLA
jgi:hypothetical protein